MEQRLRTFVVKRNLINARHARKSQLYKLIGIKLIALESIEDYIQNQAEASNKIAVILGNRNEDLR
jgi:hypothetical protein